MIQKRRKRHFQSRTIARSKTGRGGRHSTDTRIRTDKKVRRRRRVRSDPGLENALRCMRAGLNQRLAAKGAGVPVKRFRKFLRDNRLAKFKGRRWRFTDRRRRRIVAITTRGIKELSVRGFDPSSWAMAHRNAVRKFLDTGDISVLAQFEGVSITDDRGRKHLLETRPRAKDAVSRTPGRLDRREQSGSGDRCLR